MVKDYYKLYLLVAMVHSCPELLCLRYLPCLVSYKKDFNRAVNARPSSIQHTVLISSRQMVITFLTFIKIPSLGLQSFLSFSCCVFLFMHHRNKIYLVRSKLLYPTKIWLLRKFHYVHFCRICWSFFQQKVTRSNVIK